MRRGAFDNLKERKEKEKGNGKEGDKERKEVKKGSKRGDRKKRRGSKIKGEGG